VGVRRDFLRLLNKPTGVKFATPVHVVEAFGFELHRSEGSHRMYKHQSVPGLLNLQDR